MKKLLAVLFVASAACGGHKPAPTPAPPPPPPVDAAVPPDAPVDAAPTGPIAGAYSDVDVTDPDAKTEADKAIALLRTKQKDRSIKLKAIKAFSRQVVAGMNYKLDLDLTTKKGAKSVSVVMYVDLQQKASLTDVTGF